MRYALGILLIWLSLIQPAFSGQIRLVWDANTENDLKGYKVYYGTAPWSFGEPIKIGKAASFTLTGLTKGERYYIAVTAYDRTENESGYSNQVWGIAHDVLYGEWVFDVSRGDKAGAVIQFEDSDNTFRGHGISDRFNLFSIEGNYEIDDSGFVSGTYTVYDFDKPQSILETGSLSGEVGKKGTTLTLDMENWATMFNGTLFLKDPLNPKYPVVPEEWTGKVTRALKGTVDPVWIEPYPVNGNVNSHVFKISGAGDITNAGPCDLTGLFLLTLTSQNKVYGLYDISGGAAETGFFSGTMNRPMTKFNFSLVGDNGKRSNFTGQAKQ